MGKLTCGTAAQQVKKRHASDPRYTAVNSSSLREQLFQKHLASLASGGSRPDAPTQASSSSSSASVPAPKATKEDKAARAAASLREREEKVRLEQMRAARSAERARGHLGKDEAEREFAQLLVDAVRDHNVSAEGGQRPGSRLTALLSRRPGLRMWRRVSRVTLASMRRR